MTLATINPWQVLDQIQKEAFTPGSARRWHPAADITETDAGYQITLDLPGVRPEDVSIEVHDQKLQIKGERAAPQNQSEKVHYSERVFGSFQRVFRLPKDSDENAISANFDFGVLNVKIPKLEKAKPRKISIDIG